MERAVFEAKGILTARFRAARAVSAPERTRGNMSHA